MSDGKEIVSEASLLAGRFKEVLLDGKWIANTNYKDSLRSISWEEANTKIGELNTIAALAFHINYYIEGILNVFNGGELEIRDKYSFNAPVITNQDDWEKLLNTINQNAETFTEHVKILPDSKLSDIFVKPAYGTYRRNIEGVIEHSYYHLGQISLLKKMITAE